MFNKMKNNENIPKKSFKIKKTKIEKKTEKNTNFQKL